MKEFAKNKKANLIKTKKRMGGIQLSYFTAFRLFYNLNFYIIRQKKCFRNMLDDLL